ncbi:uncharacterized protein LOC132553619 [Ylistrum balloti]|uniref:uncharacterized protein LOC132553619 n=1 Tax=Ylistrum balloti TaxID=509963 RepID=UPI0029059C1E|nr:uncharacterized protein LOC132553619 [Ylistrum balloti]
MMKWFPVCFILAMALPGNAQQSTEQGSGCGVTVCYGGSKMLRCDSSQILITNVTDSSTGNDDVRAFQNLRRMCMGKSSCDTSVICNKRSLKVSYLCISEFSMERTCTGILQELTSLDGFIQSPSYPSTTIDRCQWRILVPNDSYVTITVHDLEKTGQTQSHCEAGIQLSTSRDCVNHTVPSNTICHADNLEPMVACGDVTVNLVPSDIQHSKVRFWLSYKVINFGDSVDLDLRQLSTTCPEGTYDKHMSVVSSLQGLSEDALIQPDSSDLIVPVEIITSNITILEKREIIQADMTERTVFYIAVAVAAISLTGLVIVTVVCIRRQRTLKAAGSIQVNRLPARPTVSNASANRPLPPIDKETKPAKQNGHSAMRASLQDGYSRVADEIPYNSSQDSTRSPAYAEVDDNISPVPGRHVFRFGLNGERKSSVENVYSELNEEGDVYYEIYDKYAASPGPLSSDHDQLLKGKKSDKKHHSISPKPGRSSNRPISFEGPYAHMDGRTVSKDLSDSDCSLVLMDNEVYDHYESAHV